MTPKTPQAIECPLRKEEDASLLLDHCAQRLDREQSALVTAHLASCPECRAFCERQSATWSALDLWDEVPVSNSFRRELDERIHSEPAWVSRLRGWASGISFKPAIPLGIAAALFLVLVNVPSRQLPPPPETRDVQVAEQAERALEDIDMLEQLKLRVE